MKDQSFDKDGNPQHEMFDGEVLRTSECVDLCADFDEPSKMGAEYRLAQTNFLIGRIGKFRMVRVEDGKPIDEPLVMKGDTPYHPKTDKPIAGTFRRLRLSRMYVYEHNSRFYAESFHCFDGPEFVLSGEENAA